MQKTNIKKLTNYLNSEDSEFKFIIKSITNIENESYQAIIEASAVLIDTISLKDDYLLMLEKILALNNRIYCSFIIKNTILTLFY